MELPVFDRISHHRASNERVQVECPMEWLISRWQSHLTLTMSTGNAATHGTHGPNIIMSHVLFTRKRKKKLLIRWIWINMNQLVRINLTNKSLPFGDALHLSPVKNHIFVHLEENPFFLNFVIDSKHHFKCKNFEQSYVNGSLKLCEHQMYFIHILMWKFLGVPNTFWIL